MGLTDNHLPGWLFLVGSLLFASILIAARQTDWRMLWVGLSSG
jgi:hypothetical protein